jgi:hypothetical protein
LKQDRDPAPFFLVGQPKSGTTWLMELLNSHPEILCMGEGFFFGRGAPFTLQTTLSNALDAWVSFNPAVNRWTRHEDDPTAEQILSLIVRYVMKHKLERIRQSDSEKWIVGDKTPLVGKGTLCEISVALPDAKVIHILRDGRDVAVSWVHYEWNNAAHEGGFFTLTPEQIARRAAYRSAPAEFRPGRKSLFGDQSIEHLARWWKTNVSRALDEGSRLLESRYCEVRYEDLLATGSVKEIRRLLRFLGANSSAESARQCIEDTSFERMSGRIRGDEDTTSFFRKGVSRDWKNYFTERDKELFKEVAGDLLVRLGYERDHDW